MGKILVLGSSNTDMTVKTATLPAPGETVLGGDFTMSPGGKGANQAVAAIRAGGEVSFICKVGRDQFGDNALAHYSEEGIDISASLRSDRPSGVALITVDRDAENCIVVASGANADFSVEDVRNSRALLQSCDILLMQLEIPIPAVVEAARIASEAGATVVLNPAPYCELPEEVFRHVSLFIPNRTELSSFSGVKVSDVESAVRAAGVQGCGQDDCHDGKPGVPDSGKGWARVHTCIESGCRGHHRGWRYLLRSPLCCPGGREDPSGGGTFRNCIIGNIRYKDGCPDSDSFKGRD